MSWEDQGRQEHGRFGHGTAGNEAAVAERPVDVVDAVGRAAVSALGGAAGRQFGLMLDQGGLADLRDALPVWASAAGMAPEAFRAAVVGPAFSAAGAEALREAGRIVSDGSGDAAAVRAAGGKLAAAFARMAGEEQGYALNYAADMARYAAANGAALDQDVSERVSIPRSSREGYSISRMSGGGRRWPQELILASASNGGQEILPEKRLPANASVLNQKFIIVLI